MNAKHDEDCLRRKAEARLEYKSLYTCTCGMTDAEVEKAKAETLRWLVERRKERDR